MKAIVYIRVSTDQQADRGVSLDAQRERVRAMAVVQGTELLDVIVDGGESAKSMNRPGLQRVLSMVESGKVQAVIVAKLDRLTRSVKDLCILPYSSQMAARLLLVALIGAFPWSVSAQAPSRNLGFPSWPWPPPVPSAWYESPYNPHGVAPTTLGVFADAVGKAFRTVGHEELAWYSVLSGFAAVSQAERITEDGTPLPGLDRFVDRTKPRIKSFNEYLDVLLAGPPGTRYRIFVIMVTPGRPVFLVRGPQEFSTFKNWLFLGAASLPSAIRAQPARGYPMFVLIYVFERRRNDKSLRLDLPSSITALEHARRSGLLRALDGQN
jgi:hypothetical protein